MRHHGKNVAITGAFVARLDRARQKMSWSQFEQRYGVKKNTFNNWRRSLEAGGTAFAKSELVREVCRRLGLSHRSAELGLPAATCAALDDLAWLPGPAPAEPPPPPPRPAPAEYVVEEHLQVLDLRDVGPSPRGQPEDRAVLLDRYRFRNPAGDARQFCFCHATTGERIEGRCVSHPDGYKWVETADADPRWRRRYQMRVSHPPLADGEVHTVLAEFRFVNAFEGREWFQAGVVFPTHCLTLVLLFPDHRPCRYVKGSAFQWVGRSPTPRRSAPPPASRAAGWPAGRSTARGRGSRTTSSGSGKRPARREMLFPSTRGAAPRYDGSGAMGPKPEARRAMNVTLTLPPETQKRLEELAAREGQSVEGYVERLVEGHVWEAEAAWKDLLDTAFMERCAREADPGVTLEAVRRALSKVPGSLTEDFRAERDERLG